MFCQGHESVHSRIVQMRRASDAVRVYRLLCDRPYRAKQIAELLGNKERYTYRVLHDLLNSKNQIVAFAKWHGDEIDELKSRMVLDKRYRKFEETKHSGLSKLISKYNTENIPEEQREEFKPVYERTFKVKSKGNEYIVGYSKNQLTCSCIGFGYRGKCKHADVVKKQHFSSVSVQAG